MKPQTSETREQILGRDGESSSTSALCIQAEGNTFSLTLAKITAPVEFCIVPGRPPDTYLFKFAARRSARAVTSPLSVLIFAAYLQYCSPVCLWLLNIKNVVTVSEILNPREQSISSEHSMSGPEPRSKHNFANPLGSRGLERCNAEPFRTHFLAAKIFLTASQLISEIDLGKLISIWTLVSWKGVRTWPSPVTRFWNWEQRCTERRCFLLQPGVWRVTDRSHNVPLLNASASYTTWQLRAPCPHCSLPCSIMQG